jgi:hypothetical protein
LPLALALVLATAFALPWGTSAAFAATGQDTAECTMTGTFDFNTNDYPAAGDPAVGGSGYGWWSKPFRNPTGACNFVDRDGDSASGSYSVWYGYNSGGTPAFNFTNDACFVVGSNPSGQFPSVNGLPEGTVSNLSFSGGTSGFGMELSGNPSGTLYFGQAVPWVPSNGYSWQQELQQPMCLAYLDYWTGAGTLHFAL